VICRVVRARLSSFSMRWVLYRNAGASSTALAIALERFRRTCCGSGLRGSR